MRTSFVKRSSWSSTASIPRLTASTSHIFRDVKLSDSNIRVFFIRLEGLCPRCECTYKILLATGPSLYCKAIHGCTRFTRCQAFGDIDM